MSVHFYKVGLLCPRGGPSRGPVLPSCPLNNKLGRLFSKLDNRLRTWCKSTKQLCAQQAIQLKLKIV